MIDVLVVGGGPAGASCAAFCARAGLRTVLIDRAHFPREKACAEYLSPEAGRDLEALGVLGQVEAAGAVRLAGFRLVSDDGRDVCGRYAGATPFTPFRPFGLALPRRVLDPIVLDSARRAGADVREGVALERLIVDGGTVTGAVTRGAGGRERLQARIVVGADGLHSRVARQLRLARRGHPERLAIVAHLEDVTGCADLGEMFAGPGWYVRLAPIGAGLVNAAMVVPAAEARGIGAGAGEFLLRRLSSLPELRRRIAGARIARPAMITGPFARRASSTVADGALLVGDAADFFDPFTGEGIFAALRGGRLAAGVIAAALAAGRADRAALRPYARARRAAFMGKWVLERVVGLGATRPALMRRFTSRLARRQRVADLWVGAAGDHVPVRTLFAPRQLLALVA
jgi:flavin-dependent dehydrogenase